MGRLGATLDQLENLLEPASDALAPEIAPADPIIAKMRVAVTDVRLDLPARTASNQFEKFASVIAVGADVFFTRTVAKATLAEVK